MAELRSDFRICFFFVFVVCCIKCNGANVFDSNSDIGHSFYDMDWTDSDVDVECSTELLEIKYDMNEHQIWALKIIDSWGKPPSAILNGNFFELGGFSECLNIDRNGEKYKTQYCLGQLIAAGDMVDKFLNGSRLISPEYVLPQPENGLAITFGLCLPAVCSLATVEPLLSDLISQYMPNISGEISVKLYDHTRQFEESPSDWRPIDVFAITFLVFILCLMVASTVYDIICQIKHRERSQILVAFSVYTNGTKLLSYKQSNSPEVMGCLHGIRVISTFWIVYGHTLSMFIKIPVSNLAEYPAFVAKYRSMFLFSAPIAVDTFFVMSGLLVSIGSLKVLEKTGKLNVPLMYFHRFLRLTPLLAVCILLTVSLIRFVGDGPIWPIMTDLLGKQCERNWWATLLYIQNYVNADDMCYTYSWYLAVDTQLYMIAPAIMYLIYRFNTKTISALAVLVIGCIAGTIGIYIKHELKTLLDIEKWTLAYYPTHLRFSSWLIGVIAGYVFFKTRNTQIHIPKIFNLFAWTLSLTSMVVIIFINYPLTQLDSKSTPLAYAFYDALGRVVWSISLCYIIFACINNYGGPVNTILAHPLWQPLSRLCYSIYLMHFFVIRITMASIKTTVYFTEISSVHAFVGNFVLTVFVSLVTTLAFESPILAIEKLIFKPKTAIPTEVAPINQNFGSQNPLVVEQGQT